MVYNDTIDNCSNPWDYGVKAFLAELNIQYIRIIPWDAIDIHFNYAQSPEKKTFEETSPTKLGQYRL